MPFSQELPLQGSQSLLAFRAALRISPASSGGRRSSSPCFDPDEVAVHPWEMDIPGRVPAVWVKSKFVCSALVQSLIKQRGFWFLWAGEVLGVRSDGGFGGRSLVGLSPRCFRRFLRSGGQRTAPQPLCQADFRVSLERGSGKRRLCGTSAPLEEPREGSERGGSSWRRWLGRRRLEREEAAQEDLYLEARPEPRGSASVSLPGRREGSPTKHTGACGV